MNAVHTVYRRISAAVNKATIKKIEVQHIIYEQHVLIVTGIPTDARTLKKSCQNNIEDFDIRVTQSFLVTISEKEINTGGTGCRQGTNGKSGKTEVNSILNMSHVFIF